MKNILLVVAFLTTSLISCNKSANNTTNTNVTSEIKVTFRGKSYVITPSDYPLLYASTISFPIANNIGGQQQISKISFYGENKQIAFGITGFKKGSPIGTYLFENMEGQYGIFWHLGAYYQYSQDIPAASNSNVIPAAGDIIAVTLVDITQGNTSYIPIPSTSTINVTNSDDKHVSGTFTLQLKNGTSTELATGTFSFNK